MAIYRAVQSTLEMAYWFPQISDIGTYRHGQRGGVSGNPPHEGLLFPNALARMD